MLLVLLIPGLINSGMRNIHPNSLPVGRAESVGGVDPAVGVQHILGDVLGVDAVDGVAHVLPGGDKEREGEASHHRDRVMKPEDARVDLDMGKLHQTLQSAK